MYHFVIEKLLSLHTCYWKTKLAIEELVIYGQIGLSCDWLKVEGTLASN